MLIFIHTAKHNTTQHDDTHREALLCVSKTASGSPAVPLQRLAPTTYTPPPPPMHTHIHAQEQVPIILDRYAPHIAPCANRKTTICTTRLTICTTRLTIYTTDKPQT